MLKAQKSYFKLSLRFVAIISFMVIILYPYITAPSFTTPEPEIQIEETQAEPEKKVIFEETGKATYYSPGPKGKILELTAAHKTLKRGTIVRVEPINRPNYQTIEVEITDRLPNIEINAGIVIDLDKKAAIAMSPSFIRAGKIKVKITVLEP